MLVCHLGAVERLGEAAIGGVAVELGMGLGSTAYPKKYFISRYSLKLFALIL